MWMLIHQDINTLIWSLPKHNTNSKLKKTQSLKIMSWSKMKKKDVAMKAEIEAAGIQATPMGLKVISDEIEHFKHPHELKQVDSYVEFTCGACGEIGQGKRYSCQHTDCQSKLNPFQLHLFCALPPTSLCPQCPAPTISSQQMQPTMIQSYAHKDHQVKEVYKNAEFKCKRCKTKGNGMRYHCDHCNLDFHQICAEHPYKMLSFMHPKHELVLRTKNIFAKCALCQHKGDLNTRMYGCDECSFYIHPICSQWPQYLLHPLHPIHPLQVRYIVSKKKCDDAKCSKKCKRWRYICDSCDVHFHFKCLLSKSMESGDHKGEFIDVLTSVTNLANEIGSQMST